MPRLIPREAAINLPSSPPPVPPVACELTGVPGAFAERMAEYRRLFGLHLSGRSRTATAVTFRFRADPGVEDWVRDLARREKACCAFFGCTVTASGPEVCWEVTVPEDEAARQALAAFYGLADIGSWPAPLR